MNTNSNEDFLKHLHDEKLDTQEVRTKYVIRKLIFATALLGAGVTKIDLINLSSLLYLVPFVTIAFDLYILGEDYSVKRIGGFLGIKSTNPIENEWEIWVSKNRDPFAPFSMSFLTSLVTIGAAIALWHKGLEIPEGLFISIFAIALLFIWGLFFFYRRLKKSVLKNLKIFQSDKSANTIPKTILNLRNVVQNADHIINKKVYEEIKHFFFICLCDPATLNELQSLNSEYGRHEYFRCVNSDGKTLDVNKDIIEDFRKTKEIYPWFELWFKEDTITVNSTNKSTLLVGRWLCHLVGLRHTSVHLFIDHPDKNKYTLIQVRSLKKYESPGKFDLPVAGHVIGNETILGTLYSELKQELNLTPDDIVDLSEIRGYEYTEPLDNSNIRNIEFRVVYRSQLKSESLIKMNFLDQEVAAISVFSLSELQSLIKNYPNTVASGLRESFSVYNDR